MMQVTENIGLCVPIGTAEANGLPVLLVAPVNLNFLLWELTICYN